MTVNISGIEVNLIDMLNKTAIDQAIYPKFLDDLFARSIDFYKSVLDGNNHLPKDPVYAYSKRLEHSIARSIFSHVLIDDDAIIEEIKVKTSKLELAQSDVPEFFKATYFSIFLHELFHLVQYEPEAAKDYRFRINDEMEEGAPKFIEDLSLIALVPSLAKKLEKKGPPDKFDIFSYVKDDYGGFRGPRNLIFIFDLYENGKRTQLEKQFDYALDALSFNNKMPVLNNEFLQEASKYKLDLAAIINSDPILSKEAEKVVNWDKYCYYDWPLVGEALCAKIYLSNSRDLKKTIRKILEIGPIPEDKLIEEIRDMKIG